MMKKKIETNNAPAAIGPYSQAVEAGNLVFASGAIPVEPSTGELVEAKIELQARKAFDNLKAVLAAVGCSLDDVVKTTVFLSNMEDFATVNGIYAEYFSGEVLPARSAIQVAALPKKAMIEIEAIACKA